MKYDNQYYVLTEDDVEVATLEINKEKTMLHEDRFCHDFPIDYDGSIYTYIYCFEDDPKKEKFKIGNYFKKPYPTMIEEFKKQLVELKIYKTQFFPLIIEHMEEGYEGFYMMHCYNYQFGMHKERSKYRNRNGLYFIDSLSLDENVLDKIPEDERLIFRLEERLGMYIVHQRVVDAIEKCGIEGMRFIKVQEWG